MAWFRLALLTAITHEVLLYLDKMCAEMPATYLCVRDALFNPRFPIQSCRVRRKGGGGRGHGKQERLSLFLTYRKKRPTIRPATPKRAPCLLKANHHGGRKGSPGPLCS